MKILAVPDSFKGSLSSFEVCRCIKDALGDRHSVECVPFADGGEGFTDAYRHIAGGEEAFLECTDTLGGKINAKYIRNKDEAVIECASASGLRKEKNALLATSYGTGELILDAILHGAKKITVALGGSGCTDGGTGALSALGVQFCTESNENISIPNGKTLSEIKSIKSVPDFSGISLTLACDVTNPLYGKNGAAYVFAKQKGADKSDISRLDCGLRNIAEIYKRHFKKDVSRISGSGAAGGLAAGLSALFNCEIKSGFDYLYEISGLEEKIKNSDLIITGEGCTDSQTLMGKLPFKICSLAKKFGKKTCIVSGQIKDIQLADIQISLVDEATSVDEAIADTGKILKNKVKQILL